MPEKNSNSLRVHVVWFGPKVTLQDAVDQHLQQKCVVDRNFINSLLRRFGVDDIGSWYRKKNMSHVRSYLTFLLTVGGINGTRKEQFSLARATETIHFHESESL